MVKLKYTDPIVSWWHSGMRSGVFFAPWMPATRATDSTSPLVIEPRAMSDAVSGFMWTLHLAMARRWLGSFCVTSTMRARPSGSRWVRRSGIEPRGYSTADLAHRPRRLHEADLTDLVPGPLGGDARADRGGDVVVAPAAPHDR